MNRQQNNGSELPQKWEKSQIEEALKLARILAAKAARNRRIAAADRDDLIQDILLALLQASIHFDPARGSWGGFVAIIARRAIADQARRPCAPPSVSLDSKEAAGILRSLAAPAHGLDAHLAMTHAADEMPDAQRALLRSIFTHRDIAATRAASNVSTATFYRELQELRCWLRIMGASPCATRRTHRAATVSLRS
ncbi:MAG: sigma-70 family RNA polymerase sigma factor [Roseomonas sp.]|nr:sigma-70 family RNA polymerase sigma factor [Roseomonas sp.]MCA3336325.1 sigma-70 family RNA polymerase sigma factor [Roseomonas sp.]MCA3347664.1 sigma-70 family RNA polymerase sigma factor [Roseomonas sp.]MCA3375175.1 sigma-70 family RNA polymerase sigma factor [Roseomonas sp.]MCA3386464.1 sigma-70 family RNA polymerase sigma factor [Roseomonas sp.]